MSTRAAPDGRTLAHPGRPHPGAPRHAAPTDRTAAALRENGEARPSPRPGVLVRVRPRTVLLVATGFAVVLLGALVVFLAVNGLDSIPG